MVSKKSDYPTHHEDWNTSVIKDSVRRILIKNRALFRQETIPFATCRHIYHVSQTSKVMVLIWYNNVLFRLLDISCVTLVMEISMHDCVDFDGKWHRFAHGSVLNQAAYARREGVSYVTKTWAWHYTFHVNHWHQFCQIRWQIDDKMNISFK